MLKGKIPHFQLTWLLKNAFTSISSVPDLYCRQLAKLNSIRLSRPGLLPVTSIEMEGLCYRPLLLNLSYGNSIPGSTGKVYQNQALLGGKCSETLYAIMTRGAEIAPSLCGAKRE